MRENDLLHHIYAGNSGLPAWVLTPPGDDMAVLTRTPAHLLIAADQLIDQVHFRLDDTPLPLIARKAITRNLSDVAAMAAEPWATVATAALPRGFGQARGAALFDALREVAEQFGCPLVGGDLAVHDGPLHLSVTILARPWPGLRIVTREGAQAGDGIYVTGELGHSYITGHHLNFAPRITAAHGLATKLGKNLHAMIDLSDGIAQDLPRIASHAEIDAEALPIRRAAGAGAKASHADADQAPWQHALGDGEDYELLFTAAADCPVPAEIEGVPVTRIGRVTDAGGHRVRMSTGLDPRLEEAASGWQHSG